MFHLFDRSKSASRDTSSTIQLLKRALSFGIGLLLLWVALNLMPESSSASKPRPASPETGALNVPGIENPTNEGISWLGKGQIAAGLLLVGLLGFAVYRHKKTAAGPLPVERFQNLGRLQLSPQQHIHLIGCGNEVFLIGATNNQISLLHRVDHDSKGAQSAAASLPQGTPSPQFSTPSSTLFISADFASQLQQHVGATLTE